MDAAKDTSEVVRETNDDFDIKQELLDYYTMDEPIAKIGEENFQMMEFSTEMKSFTIVEDNNLPLISGVVKQEPSVDLELIKSQGESRRVILQQLPTYTLTGIKQELMDVDQTDPDDVTTPIPEGSEQHEMEDIKYVNTQDYLDICEQDRVISEQDRARPGPSSKGSLNRPMFDDDAEMTSLIETTTVVTTATTLAAEAQQHHQYQHQSASASTAAAAPAAPQAVSELDATMAIFTAAETTAAMSEQLSAPEPRTALDAFMKTYLSYKDVPAPATAATVAAVVETTSTTAPTTMTPVVPPSGVDESAQVQFQVSPQPQQPSPTRDMLTYSPHPIATITINSDGQSFTLHHHHHQQVTLSPPVVAPNTSYSVPPCRDRAARFMFPEVGVKVAYVESGRSEVHAVIDRVRTARLDTDSTPQLSPVLHKFSKGRVLPTPSKTGKRNLRTHSVRNLRYSKISCNEQQVITRYACVSSDEDEEETAAVEATEDADEDPNAKSDDMCAISARRLGFVTTNLAAVNFDGEELCAAKAVRSLGTNIVRDELTTYGDMGYRHNMLMVNGISFGSTAKSEELVRYMRSLKGYSDGGRSQLQPRILNHASDHIDFILRQGRFPKRYVSNGMLHHTLAQLAECFVLNTGNLKMRKHSRTQKPRSIKNNVHMHEGELELLVLAYYHLSATDLVSNDYVSEPHYRALAEFNLAWAQRWCETRYKFMLADFCNAHTPNETLRQRKRDGSKSLSRYVESESRAQKYFTLDARKYAEFQRVLKARRALQVLVDALNRSDGAHAISAEFLYLLKKFYTSIIQLAPDDADYTRHWHMLMYVLKAHHYLCPHTQVAMRLLATTLAAIATHSTLEFDEVNQNFSEFAILSQNTLGELLSGYVLYNHKTMGAYKLDKLIGHHLYAVCKNFITYFLTHHSSTTCIDSNHINSYSAQCILATGQIAPFKLAQPLPSQFRNLILRYLWTGITACRIRNMQYRVPLKLTRESRELMLQYVEYEHAVIVSRAILAMSPEYRESPERVLHAISCAFRDAICRLEAPLMCNLDSVSLFDDNTEYTPSDVERSEMQLRRVHTALPNRAELGVDIAAESDCDNSGSEAEDAHRNAILVLKRRQELVNTLMAKVPSFEEARAPWRHQAFDANQDGGKLRRKHHSRCVLCGLHTSRHSIFIRFPEHVDPNSCENAPRTPTDWLNYNRDYCVVTACSVCYYEINRPNSNVTREQLDQIADRARRIVRIPFGLVETEGDPDVVGYRAFCTGPQYMTRGAPACHIFHEYRKYCKLNHITLPKAVKCNAYGEIIKDSTRKPRTAISTTADSKSRRPKSTTAVAKSSSKGARGAKKLSEVYTAVMSYIKADGATSSSYQYPGCEFITISDDSDTDHDDNTAHRGTKRSNDTASTSSSSKRPKH